MIFIYLWLRNQTIGLYIAPTLLLNRSKIKEQNLMGQITVVPEQEPEQAKATEGRWFQRGVRRRTCF
jgi:hypothetical protein